MVGTAVSYWMPELSPPEWEWPELGLAVWEKLLKPPAPASLA
jgi:hypothetical protein